MPQDRRQNWKENLSEAAKAKSEKRKELLLQKERISEQIRKMSIEEIKSPAYDEMKRKQGEIIAKLATL